LALQDCHPALETPSESDPFHQPKPAFCTRLHSCRDIRLDPEEQWVIQEGSLVIGLDPEYTSLSNHERRPDEFEVSSGDVYVVCSMYADLWALCVKVSFHIPPTDDASRKLAFLPLCSITLAPNYSTFTQRCNQCARNSLHEQKYPGNGLPINPPQRSHSLTASKQIFHGVHAQILVPLVAQDVIQSLSLKHASDNYVPLDSTLKPILSPLTSRRHRLLRRIGAGKSGSKDQDNGRQLMKRRHVHRRDSPLISACRKIGSRSSFRRMQKEWQDRSSEGIHALKWFSGKS
jgi:hypothetical protein